jgi:hypothetical protein
MTFGLIIGGVVGAGLGGLMGYFNSRRTSHGPT